MNFQKEKSLSFWADCSLVLPSLLFFLFFLFFMEGLGLGIIGMVGMVSLVVSRIVLVRSYASALWCLLW